MWFAPLVELGLSDLPKSGGALAPAPGSYGPESFLDETLKVFEKIRKRGERKFIQVKALDIKLFLKKDFGTKQVPIKNNAEYI